MQEEWTGMAPSEQPCNFDFNTMDDRSKVEARRAALGLPPLDIHKEIVLENPNCTPVKQDGNTAPVQAL
jgi:hypothetical protein